MTRQTGENNVTLSWAIENFMNDVLEADLLDIVK